MSSGKPIRQRRKYPKLWGMQTSPIAKGLGKIGWNWKDAKFAIESLWKRQYSEYVDYNVSSVRQAISDGRSKNPRDNKHAAVLSPAQIDELNEALAAIKTTIFPDELPIGRLLHEGAKCQVVVNAYERSREARAACLEEYGFECNVCEISMASMYGEIAEGRIHVHHLKPLADIGEAYKVDPIHDLRPVCPNCHMVLHLTDPPMTIDELRKRIVEQAAS